MSRPAGTSQEAWDAAGDIIVNHGNRTGTLVVSLQAPIARAIDAAILSAKAEQRKLAIDVIDTLLGSLMEGLMTDVGLTDLDRTAMTAYLDLISAKRREAN